MQSAGPRIDCAPPSSAGLVHVRDKRKKDQQEKERQAVIQVTLKCKMMPKIFSTVCSEPEPDHAAAPLTYCKEQEGG